MEDKNKKNSKLYLFEQFYPNGDLAYSKSVKTLKEALELYEKENGWWFQCLSYNGKIIKHNNNNNNKND